MMAGKETLTKTRSLQPFFCRYCTKRVSCNDSFRRHCSRHRQRKHHHAPLGYNQRHSELRRASLEEQVESTEAEDEEESFQCDHCNQQFFSKFGLEGHQLACNTVQTFPYTPPPGEKPFPHHFSPRFGTVPGPLFSPVRLFGNPLPISSPMLSPPSSEEFNTLLYRCRYCPKSFTKELVKEVHEKHHFRRTYTKSYQCGYCSQSFTAKSVCKLHQKTHLQGEFHGCDACAFTCVSKKQLRRHKKKDCTVRKQFKCDELCGKRFTTEPRLAKHVKKHLLDEMDKEQGVDFKQEEKSDYVEQKSGNSDVNTGRVQLDHVDEKNMSLGDKELVDDEMETVDGMMSGGKETISSELVNDKKESVGVKESAVAKKAFNDEEEETGGDIKKLLQTRTATERDIEAMKTTPTVQWTKVNGQTLFTCSFCGKAFVNQNSLNKHQRFHVKRPKIYLGSQSESKTSDGHIQYNCDLCTKIFSDKMALISHRRTHIHEMRIRRANNCAKDEKGQASHSDDNHHGETTQKKMHKKRKWEQVSTGVPGGGDGQSLYNSDENGQAYSIGTIACSEVELQKKRPRYETTSNGTQITDHGSCSPDDKDIRNCPDTTGTGIPNSDGKVECSGGTNDPDVNDFSDQAVTKNHTPKQTKQVRITDWMTNTDSRPKSKETNSDKATVQKDNKSMSSPKTLDIHKASNVTLSSPKTSIGTGRCEKKSKAYSCNQCDKTLSTIYNLNRHTKVVHSKDVKKKPGVLKEKIHECTQCSKSFAKKQVLTQHIMLIHSGMEKQHECTQCSKSFARKGDLTRHMPIHSGTEKPHECTQCSKSFARKGDLTRHVRTHSGVKPFTCQHCGLAFTRHYYLTRHENKHTGAVTFKCQKCGESFLSRDDLLYHEQKHKSIRNKYSCKQCDKGFAYSSALAYHMASVHTAQKYKCDICEKSFYQKGDLNIHERVHQVNKPFQCSHCDKAFNSKQHLRRHEKRRHSGETVKPFQCNFCTKRYVDKRYLETHVKKHHAKKKYRLVVKFTKDNDQRSNCSDENSSNEESSASDSEIPSDLESVSSVSSSSSSDEDSDEQI